jgi:hypothetical protein
MENDELRIVTPALAPSHVGLATFTETTNGIRYTNNSVWSDGRTNQVTADLTLDGAWCPVTGSQ